MPLFIHRKAVRHALRLWKLHESAPPGKGAIEQVIVVRVDRANRAAAWIEGVETSSGEVGPDELSANRIPPGAFAAEVRK
jgi:hypothetical protein